MAKKNSSKTWTEKALSNSEPKIQVFKGWNGINIQNAPMGWEPLEEGWLDHRQTDLKPNFFMLQNNLDSNDDGTIETRCDSELIADVTTIPNTLRHEGYTTIEFTGVTCMYHRWQFLVVRESKTDPVLGTSFIESVFWHDISQTQQNKQWHRVTLYEGIVTPPEQGLYNWSVSWEEPTEYEITEIKCFEGKLIAAVKTYDPIYSMYIGKSKVVPKSDAAPTPVEKPEPSWYVDEPVGKIFTADIENTVWQNTHHGPFYEDINVFDEQYDPSDPPENELDRYRLRSAPKIPDPIHGPGAQGRGDLLVRTYWPVEDPPGEGIIEDDEGNLHYMTTSIDLCFCYTNKFGSTLPGLVLTIYCDSDPVTWSSLRYLHIASALYQNMWKPEFGITGVDIYASVDNKQTKAFIGHVGTDDPNWHWTRNDQDEITGASWEYDWLGAMADLSAWTNVQLKIPEENTTAGVSASHFEVHDSRLYFWGDPQFPYRLYIGGNPGAELSVARGHGGAWIDVEPGTGYEVFGTAKWKTSQGANIVTIMSGNPNSGLVKRFNLVETNTQITNEISSKGYMYEEVSNVVGCTSRWGYGVYAEGLYSLNRYGLMLTTMAMEYNNQMRNQKISDAIDPVFQSRLGVNFDDARMVCIDDVIYISLAKQVQYGVDELDQVVLCYDTGNKSWYTWTHDQILNAHGEQIRHICCIDSHQHAEGLGVITSRCVYLYPIVGHEDQGAPAFRVIMETGEMSTALPKQVTHYLCQLEFRFDYFVGKCDIIVEGIDYYGRPFKVEKKCNRPETAGIKRDYVEWIRVDKLVESYRIRLVGPARFRLTNINAKIYAQSKKIGLVYGFDDHSRYADRYHGENDDHHYIEDYNNLRRAIVP